MRKKKPIIAICASASTYDRVIPLSDELLSIGLHVALPAMAETMKTEGRANEEARIDWTARSDGYTYKEKLMRDHFALIARSDAILVANYEKNGKPDYIGGNVLMEMTVAFYLKKPIFILNSASQDSPLIDEIMGVRPVFLHGDITKLPGLV
jgi:hypothetical protein